MSSIIIFYFALKSFGGSKNELSQAFLWSLAAISGKTLRSPSFNKQVC